MSLAALTVRNVRRLAQCDVELHSGCNLVWGPNGSGKTSFLEAIYLLGRGRSFRTRNTERLIRHGESELMVLGRTASVPSRLLGVQTTRGSPTIAKIAGEFATSLAELSQVLPVQVIEPGVHKLVEESAQRRRRWLDWGVFHVEPLFVETWARYGRALKQRNAALRSQMPVAVWDAQLLEYGAELSASRERFIDLLHPHWSEVVQALIGEAVTLGYSPGWSRHESFAEALARSAERDRLRGITHVGPHRADVALRVGGRVAREVLSRGQQKLVAAAMILAQLKLLRERLPEPAVLLLDDPAAELDSARLEAFVSQVVTLRCQLVLTSLTPEQAAFGRPDRVFHVEQGRVGSV
jgi:DNA replication and repair protein RecF